MGDKRQTDKEEFISELRAILLKEFNHRVIDEIIFQDLDNFISNADMVHKGDASQLKSWLRSKELDISWLVTSASFYDPETMQDDRLENIIKRQIDDGIEHTYSPIYTEPTTDVGKKALAKLKKKSETAIGYSFRDAYDPNTGTLYFGFTPKSDGTMADALYGDPTPKNLYGKKSAYTFNAEGGQVSAAIMEQYVEQRNTILKRIEMFKERGPLTNVVFAGHSNGGALAYLAGADDAFTSYNVRVNTFGGVAVGDATFNKGFSNKNNVQVNRTLMKADPLAQNPFWAHPPSARSVWDISPEGYNPWTEFWEKLKNRKSTFFDTLGDTTELTHYGSSIDEMLNKIAGNADGYADLDQYAIDRRPGELVNKNSDFFMIAKKLRDFKMSPWEHMNLVKFMRERGPLVWESFKNNSKLVNNPITRSLVDKTNNLLQKAGFSFQNPKQLSNLGQDIFENFDAQLNHAIAKDTDLMEKMISSAPREWSNTMREITLGRLLDDDVRNHIPNEYYEHGDLDGSRYALDKKETSALFGEIDLGYKEFGDDGFAKNINLREANYIEFGEGGFLREPGINNQKHMQRKIGQMIQRGGARIKRTLDGAEKFINTEAPRIKNGVLHVRGQVIKTGKEIKTKAAKQIEKAKLKAKETIAPGGYTGIQDDPKMKTAKVTPVTEFKVGNQTNVFKVDEPPAKKRKLTPLNIQFKDTIDIKKRIEQAMGGEITKQIKKGINNVATSKLGQQVQDAGMKLMASRLMKLIKAGNTEALKLLAKGGKKLTKVLPLISAGLETGFTVSEIIEDLDRIEDEKVYIQWNGEYIFQLYNPEEYQELVTLRFIYDSSDVTDQVTWDEFANTWWGRIGQTEDGVTTIDGIPTNSPNFDTVYQERVVDLQGRENVDISSQSKTLNVIKNVGMGLINIAMDLAASTTGANIMTAVVATGGAIVDEHFEQQAIDSKANGFRRAMQERVINQQIHKTVKEQLISAGKQDNEALKELLTRYYVASIKGDENQDLKLKLIKMGLDRGDIEHFERTLGIQKVLYDQMPPSMVAQMATGMLMGKSIEVLLPFLTFGQMLGGLATSDSTRMTLNALKKMKEYDSVIVNFQSRNKGNALVLKNMARMRDEVNKYFDALKNLVTNEQIGGEQLINIVNQALEFYTDEFKFIEAMYNGNSEYRQDPDIRERIQSVSAYTLEKISEERDLLKGEFETLLSSDEFIEYQKEFGLDFKQGAEKHIEEQQAKYIMSKANLADEQTLMSDLENYRIYTKIGDWTSAKVYLEKLRGYGFSDDDLGKYKAIDSWGSSEAQNELIKIISELDNIGNEVAGPETYVKRWMWDKSSYSADSIQRKIENNPQVREKYLAWLRKSYNDPTVNSTLTKWVKNSPTMGTVVKDVGRVENETKEMLMNYKHYVKTGQWSKVDPIVSRFRQLGIQDAELSAFAGKEGTISSTSGEVAILRQYVEHLRGLKQENTIENKDGTSTTETYLKPPETDLEGNRVGLGVVIETVQDKEGFNIQGMQAIDVDKEDFGGSKAQIEYIAERENKIQKLGDKSVEYGFDPKDIPKNLGYKPANPVEENADIDRGLPGNEPDKENNATKFTPSGKIMTFSFDGGRGRMLFEDGSEKMYGGPMNALVGGITQGYWTGVVPNGKHAPINTLDSYMMAFHIENQENEQKAKLRLISRISKAIEMKTISVENDIVEFRIATLLIEHMKRYKTIFGIDISGAFMGDGMGAEINSQLYENENGMRRHGALPAGVQIPENMEIEENVKKPISRAAQIARELGDKMMAAKFSMVASKAQEMERIANEYIEAVRGKSGGGGMDRLILEESLKEDDISSKYVMALLSALNKPLY